MDVSIAPTENRQFVGEIVLLIRTNHDKELPNESSGSNKFALFGEPNGSKHEPQPPYEEDDDWTKETPPY